MNPIMQIIALIAMIGAFTINILCLYSYRRYYHDRFDVLLSFIGLIFSFVAGIILFYYGLLVVGLIWGILTCIDANRTYTYYIRYKEFIRYVEEQINNTSKTEEFPEKNSED